MSTETTSTTDTGRERALAVGSSALLDARAAGREAASAVLDSAPQKLLVVLASSMLDHDSVLAGVREISPTTPLIGCSTSGEISGGGPRQSSVVVMSLSGDGFSVATGLGEVQDGDIRGAAAQAARCTESVDPYPHKVLLILSDGLAGDQQEVVRGAYQQVGAAIPLVGGCAGDDMRMDSTRQFYGDRVMDQAIVAAAIASDAPIGVGVKHGWRAVGEPMIVTEADGVVVKRLDDRPALDVYLERLSAPPAASTDATEFTAFAETRPLGLSRRGREEIRFVATANMEDRSIECFAEVPQGGTCSFMSGDSESILRATDEACAEALAPVGRETPTGVLVFDCIARKGVLGNRGIEVEVGRIAERTNGAPLAGFYTYGEFARTKGPTGFHNQTLVVLAFG